MIESPESEIDVEVLKARIREAVELREASGQMSFIAASRELFKVISAKGSGDAVSLADLLVEDIFDRWEAEPRLSLQPEFHPRADDHYRINELVQYHDHEFIWNAYRAILKREPDEEGYQGYLGLLRSGRRNKIDILASLRFSPEGRRASVEVEGLKARAWFRRLYLLPVVGYVAELTVSIVRLPALMRSQRQLENHFSAQQEVIVHYVNERFGEINERFGEQSEDQRNYRNNANLVTVRFAEGLANLKKQQADFAGVQHQQVAALFRNQQRTLAKQRFTTNGQPSIPEKAWDELYASFETQFRGDPEILKSDLRPYLSILKEAEVTADVLDLGCGRGEWLDLLKENGLKGVGVEANSVLAAEVRSKQLDVVETDAIQYMRGLKNESLEAVTAFHLIEHLELAQLLQLLEEIKRTLKQGGLLILETPNPKNLVVGACNFYSDPTHRRPLFPDTVQFLLNHLGFRRVRIEYLHPVEGSPFNNTQAGSKELDTWLFGPRDFAAIAWKD